jgi:CTP:molybdopterin cytidylyltransferase MocA
MTAAKNRMAFGVIILGAGASSRMSRPKLLLPWGETSIIGHLIEQWQALAAAQIAVVCRRDDWDLHAELERLGFPQRDRIENPHPERGMFSSILCAVRWKGWRAGLGAWAIVLGDQPHLRPDTLRALLACQREHPTAVCQPVCDGHARHPVFLPRPAFGELARSRAKTLKVFLKQISYPLVKCPIEDSGLTLDLDWPEDYKKALKDYLG